MFEDVSSLLWETGESLAGGADPKLWVTDGIDKYLLKRGQYRFPLEPYSEYVASRFIASIGLPVQSVELVRFRGSTWAKCSYAGEIKQFKDIVDCSIFTDVNKEFWILSDLLAAIAEMRELTADQRYDFIEKFKLLFVAEAVLANGDRHAGNFGYMYSGGMSPVYDNGAALFPDIFDISKRFNRVTELLSVLVMDAPISTIQIKPTNRHKHKDTYYTMLRSGELVGKEIRYFTGLDIGKIVLNSVAGLPEGFQRFYVYVLKLRYDVILRGIDFNKAVAGLSEFDYKFPESVGELCSQLRI